MVARSLRHQEAIFVTEIRKRKKEQAQTCMIISIISGLMQRCHRQCGRVGEQLEKTSDVVAAKETSAETELPLS